MTEELKRSVFPAGELGESKNNKVLLLEYDPHLLGFYSTQLQDAGFEVFAEDDEDKGLNMALKEKPDIILLDISLPKNDDFGFIREMKNREEIAFIPVVILTDLSQEADIKKGEDCGAVEYLIRDNSTFSEVIKSLKCVLSKK